MEQEYNHKISSVQHSNTRSQKDYSNKLVKKMAEKV